MINHIQNKSFCVYNICVCTVCIYYVYKIHTHACIYLWKICYVYIYIYIYLYMISFIWINTCKYFPNIFCMCVALYIHKIYTVHTHILCKLKLLFWMRLIAINLLTADKIHNNVIINWHFFHYNCNLKRNMNNVEHIIYSFIHKM